MRASHPGMGYSKNRSNILIPYASQAGMRPTVVGRIHPRVGWRGLCQKLPHKTVLAQILGIDFKRWRKN